MTTNSQGSDKQEYSFTRILDRSKREYSYSVLWANFHPYRKQNKTQVLCRYSRGPGQRHVARAARAENCYRAIERVLERKRRLENQFEHPTRWPNGDGRKKQNPGRYAERFATPKLNSIAHDIVGTESVFVWFSSCGVMDRLFLRDLRGLLRTSAEWEGTFLSWGRATPVCIKQAEINKKF